MDWIEPSTIHGLLEGQKVDALAKTLDVSRKEARAFVIVFHGDARVKELFKKNLFKTALKNGVKYFDLGDPKLVKTFQWRLALFLHKHGVKS